MGNSQVRKIFFQGDCVETSFSSLYEINVVDINKQEESMAYLQGHYSLAVNSSSNSDLDVKQLQQLQQLVEGTDIHLLLFPSNTFRNENKSYSEIKKFYEEILPQNEKVKILQKVEVNGDFTHPVYKYLKRNTPTLYDKNLCHGKIIKQDFCKFLIDKNGSPIKFYTKDIPIAQIQNDIIRLQST